MRFLLFLLLLPAAAFAQSSEVRPGELSLEVVIDSDGHDIFAREMVLITIRGLYRRHITRETLKQPALEGFNWMQLGPDSWTEQQIRGQKVKLFERRMALFPDRAGQLTIGAFTHELTLTDETDDWFDHSITSAPVSIDVSAAPIVADDEWWFPVRALRVSDQWSNPPDQLARGEGVLRVIRIEAVGAAPEMIPPMPELSSPSGMIFPHPEKRLVELSPEGPVIHAFWRWTIRPGNDVSAILEPISFNYFDTVGRKGRTVTISAQRVAFAEAEARAAPPPARPARLPGSGVFMVAAAACVIATSAMLMNRRYGGLRAVRRLALFDDLARALHLGEWRGDLVKTRRAARALLMRDGPNRDQLALLRALDREIHDPAGSRRIPPCFARSFLAARQREPRSQG